MIIVEKSVDKVISLIDDLQFESYKVEDRTPYYNMTATLTDAVLQAGMNYKSVVLPRINNILSKYSEYKTTCDFIILFQTIPLEKIIQWKNKNKQHTIYNLAWYLYNEGVNDEIELSKWLSNYENRKELLKIKGIGYKTADYLSLLSGNDAIPIDRHMLNFLERAEVKTKSYEEANTILVNVANRLNVSERILDKVIWDYMSKSVMNSHNEITIEY